MHDWGNDEHKLRTAAVFVGAARELIESDGLENLSIRRIAEKAGMHNSTIYLYFKDVDQLVLLASMDHYRAFCRKTGALMEGDGDQKARFLRVWEAFAEDVFARPAVFYSFFFGRHSGDLTPVIRRYDLLFPEASSQRTEGEGMGIEERCLALLRPLVGAGGTRVTPEGLPLVACIVVACLRSCLERCKDDPAVSREEARTGLLDMIRYITGLEE